MIFHHFRLGSFDLLGGVAELNVQYMYFQHFLYFCISICLYFVHFSLESSDLVGGGGGYNVQFFIFSSFVCQYFYTFIFSAFLFGKFDFCGWWWWA